MSSMSDFIIENGVLMEYVGPGGDVVIPEGVTTIKGWPRFIGYSKPFALTLANSVVSCGVEDLLAESITALTIPAGTEFEPGSFGPNYMSFFKELREINVDPENRHCASKEGILYSKDMTILYACPAAREGAVEIPDTVTTIAERAFDGCRLLKEIVIPDSVKSIERRAFMDCKTLAKAVLPAGCAMGEEVFLRCAKLTTAGLKGTGTGKGWSLEFPWTDEIPENAFAGMNKLKKVVLPDTVRVIGKNAFKGCKALEEINLPEGVKVDKKAFKDSKNLKTTQSNDAAKQSDFTIQFGCLVAYRGADSDVVIPDGVTAIGSQAFDERLVSVTLPASVTTVEQAAFGNCRKLEKITILGTIRQAGVNAFGFFYGKPDLERSVCSAVPIRAFTKAAQETVVCAFVRRIDEFDPNSEVFRDNLRFLGAHLKQEQKFGGPFWSYLVSSVALRRALLAADAIPVKDLKWLIPALQEAGQPDVTAELLDYQNRLLSDENVRKTLEKSEARAERKALSAEMTVADWRKQLKFGYEGDGVVIKGVTHEDPVITIPDHIGRRPVRVIDRGAFDCRRIGGRKSPEQIVLPEGITEIRRGAFICVEGAEIIFPSTLKTLPEGCFLAVQGLMLHLPASIETLPEELEWDSIDPFKAIRAPSGSYAEQYAKEHNIPFEAE